MTQPPSIDCRSPREHCVLILTGRRRRCRWRLHFVVPQRQVVSRNSTSIIMQLQLLSGSISILQLSFQHVQQDLYVRIILGALEQNV